MRQETKSEMYRRLAQCEAKAGVVSHSGSSFDTRLREIKARLNEHDQAVKSFAAAQKRATASKPSSTTTRSPAAWYRSATEQWKAAIARLVEQGLDHRQAAAQVEEDQPGLREQMLREAQARR